MPWPPAKDTWEFELMKAVFSAGVATFTLLLTWGVGQWFTSRWSLWQKEREMELSTVRDFYQLYGDFIALLRSWSRLRKSPAAPGFEEARAALFERAASAEGKLEAILVKVAVERRLVPAEIRYLGLFRQAYQGMRECIRDSQRIDEAWGGDAYTIFKQLASEIACMLQRTPKHPSASEAQRNLLEITRYSSKDLRRVVEAGSLSVSTSAPEAGAADRSYASTADDEPLGPAGYGTPAASSPVDDEELESTSSDVQLQHGFRVAFPPPYDSGRASAGDQG